MSPVRKYDGLPVVRTSSDKASPFLRSLLPVIRMELDVARALYHRKPTALDLGCGSGRNGKALADHCWVEVLSFDRCPDHGIRLELGGELPVFSSCVDVVLFQFVAMFLEDDALVRTLYEIHRVASPSCLAVVEVAAVKNCRTPTTAEARALCGRMSHIFSNMGWGIHRKAGMHFLASLTPLPRGSRA